MWLVGNIESYPDRRVGNYCRGIGIACAVAWTMLRSRGQRRNTCAVLTALAIFGYLLLTEAMIGGADVRLRNALISSLVAALYIGVGIWSGARFAMLGLVVAAMIVLGWFVFPATLYLWLGIGGGGAPILGGCRVRPPVTPASCRGPPSGSDDAWLPRAEPAARWTPAQGRGDE